MGFILFFGIFWGAGEAVITMSMGTSLSRPLLGAILAGCAFFFLSGAGHALSLRMAPLLLFPLAACARVLAVSWISGGQAPASIKGPLVAYLLQSLVFAGLFFLFANQGILSGTGALLTGAGAGLFTALLYPAFASILGHDACRIAGTALPASIAYAPLTVMVAALSCRLGREAGIRLRPIDAPGLPPGAAFETLK